MQEGYPPLPTCSALWLNGKRDDRRLAGVVALNELLARAPNAPGHRQVKLSRDAFERCYNVFVHSKPESSVVCFLLSHAPMFLHSILSVKNNR